MRLRNRRFGSHPDQQSGVVPFQYEWIRERAPGRSFADIGGLWMQARAVAFAAEEAGATAASCFDVGDPALSEFAQSAATAAPRSATCRATSRTPRA